MKQVIIDAVYTQIVQLALKCFFDSVFRNLKKCRILRRNGKTVPGMPFHERFTGCLLTSAFMIDIASVKVSVPRLQESICHPVQLFIVKISRPGKYWKPHHAKAKILHCSKAPFIFGFCRILFMFPEFTGIFLSKLFRKIRQYFGYFDLLRTYLLTGTALKTGRWLLFRRQGAQCHGRNEPAAGARQSGEHRVQPLRR